MYGHKEIVFRYLNKRIWQQELPVHITMLEE
jgi:hypothetical protein